MCTMINFAANRFYCEYHYEDWPLYKLYTKIILYPTEKEVRVCFKRLSVKAV